VKHLAKAPVKASRQFVEFYDIDYEALYSYTFAPEVYAILNEVNRKVAARESLAEVMDFLFDSTIGFCPCSRITLCFFEEGGQRTVIRWTRDDDSPSQRQLTGLATDTHFTTLRGLLAKGKVRLIHDLPAFAALNPDSELTRVFVEEGYHSSMTSPLLCEGRCVGVLIRHSVQPHAFNERHVYQHLATAERLSQAVEAAARLEQVQQLNESYMEMLGFVSHELKSPLSSINMTANLLLGGYLGELSDKQRSKLESIIGKTDYLTALVRDYLELARLEGGSLHASPIKDVDFAADVVDQALSVVQSQLDEAQMKLSWRRPAQPLRVELDPNMLLIVMINLLSNAVKYGNRGGAIEIRTSLADGLLRVAVRNEGPGFPPEQKTHLFRKFSRLDTPELKKRKGTGVGLYTSWRIVRLHGGHIHAESAPGEWAEFSFQIPQPLVLSAAVE